MDKKTKKLLNIGFIVLCVLVVLIIDVIHFSIVKTKTVKTEVATESTTENDAILNSDKADVLEAIPKTVESPDNFVDTDISDSNEIVNIEKADKTMYTTSQVNIRTNCSTNDDIIETLEPGTELHVIGICNNDWVQVEHGDVTGYVYLKYLTDNQ